MLRAERSQAVCSQCQANTGGRTIRDVVRLIVSLATGGGGGLRVLCDPHAGQYSASLASVCEDGRCSSCGVEGSMFAIDMEPRKVRLCRQRCAPQALLKSSTNHTNAPCLPGLWGTRPEFVWFVWFVDFNNGASLISAFAN